MPTKRDMSARNRSTPVKDKLLVYRESVAYMAPDGGQLLGFQRQIPLDNY
jgi:hypothetical protein